MRHNKRIYKTLIAILSLSFILNLTTISFSNNSEDNFVKNGSRDKKIIALTFDDGPHPKETLEVLDVLKKYDVKATFFIAGKHANWYSKPLLRAIKENHEIGNHTFNHPDISKLSESQIEDEILKCEEILIKLTGKKPTLFRPPFGSYNENSLTSIANKLGYKIILWNTVDAKGWENPSANKIANTIIDNAKNGDIILLHDYGTENTVKALDILIPIMQQKGFKFVTVSQLINNK